MYVEAAEILAALFAIGQQFAFADNPEFGNTENLASSMTGAGAGLFGGAVQYRAFVKSQRPKQVRFGDPQVCEIPEYSFEERLGRNMSECAEEDKPLTPTPTDGKGNQSPQGFFDDPYAVILVALSIVQSLELMTGFGPAHEGGDLATGADQFGRVAEQLGAIRLDESWRGSAAQACSGRITQLYDSAQKIADLDSRFAVQVKRQADCVAHITLGFGMLADVLVASYLYVWRLMYVPESFLFSLGFANFVAVFSVMIAIGMISALIYFSVKCAGKVDSLAKEYRELNVGAEPVAASADAGISASSTFPDIAALARVASGMGAAYAPPGMQVARLREYAYLANSSAGQPQRFGFGPRQDRSPAAPATRLPESNQVPVQLAAEDSAPIEVMSSGVDNSHKSVPG